MGLGLRSRQGVVGMEIIEGFKNGRPQKIPVVLIEFGHVSIRAWALSLPHYHKGFVDFLKGKVFYKRGKGTGGRKGSEGQFIVRWV